MMSILSIVTVDWLAFDKGASGDNLKVDHNIFEWQLKSNLEKAL